MGFNPFKAVTKPLKKILKSKVGKAALLAAAYYYGPKMFTGANPQGLKGLEGWKMASPKRLYAAGTETSPESILYQGKDFILPQAKPIPSSGIIGKAANTWRGMTGLQQAATVGAGAAGLGYATMDEEDLPEELTDDQGHAQYLKNRAMYEDE